MSDLISRQAAIDAMNTRLEDIKLTWRGKVKKGEIAMYLDMRGVIETLPSAQPTVDAVPMEWIMKYYEDHPAGFVCGMIYDWAIEQAERKEE